VLTPDFVKNRPEERATLSNVNKRRVIAAFLVAPIVVPLVFSAPGLVPFHWRDFLTTLLVGAIFVLPVSYVFEILLGLPAWIIFRVYRLQSFLAFAVGGAVIGLLVDVIMKIPSKSVRDWNAGDILYVCAALCSALLFRVIAFPPAAARKP